MCFMASDVMWFWVVMKFVSRFRVPVTLDDSWRARRRGRIEPHARAGASRQAYRTVTSTSFSFGKLKRDILIKTQRYVHTRNSSQID